MSTASPGSMRDCKPIAAACGMQGLEVMPETTAQGKTIQRQLEPLPSLTRSTFYLIDLEIDGFLDLNLHVSLLESFP